MVVRSAKGKKQDGGGRADAGKSRPLRLATHFLFIESALYKTISRSEVTANLECT